ERKNQSKRDECCVWMASSLFQYNFLFPLSEKSQIVTLASVSHPFSTKSAVCLHHRGLPSSAVLLFQTLFIDHEKRAVFYSHLSVFNPIFVLVQLD
uniref:Uncharacterized protein n=1 Tax=Echeneis naucrates TaxID=173247 RepID=A0A665W9K7_ECHNA